MSLLAMTTEDGDCFVARDVLVMSNDLLLAMTTE
jgi:hypothetical protein